MQSFVTIFIINLSVEKKHWRLPFCKKKFTFYSKGKEVKKIFGVIALMGQILSHDVCPAFSFKDPFFLKSEVFQPWNFRSFFPR